MVARTHRSSYESNIPDLFYCDGTLDVQVTSDEKRWQGRISRAYNNEGEKRDQRADKDLRSYRLNWWTDRVNKTRKLYDKFGAANTESSV